MTPFQLQHIVKQGESITVEFKSSKEKLNNDAFDSICAFLNRRGGYLILGVNDNKEITGVQENWERTKMKLGENEWNILKKVHEKPTITIKELSEIICISTTAIENNISKLKDKGFLKRKGSDREGYWQIFL